MTKRIRTLAAMALTLALLVAIVAANPRTSTAANLTGGNYTYLVNGEEVTFTFDPVVRKDGLLMPVEVFEQFGITVEGEQQGTAIAVTKDPVVANLTLGQTNISLGGLNRTVNTAPLRLNGRIFLPSDLLKEFGVDLVQDGTMIIMRTFLDKVPAPLTLTDNQWAAFSTTRGLKDNLKSDGGIYLYTEMALMDDYMINTTNIGTFGTRAKLLGLLQSNTLVYVKLSNRSTRSGGLVTTGTYLVDDQRRQYEVREVVDIGSGLLNAKLVPGADRVGVLVYPKLPESVKSISLYYDSNQAVIGTFPVVK